MNASDALLFGGSPLVGASVAAYAEGRFAAAPQPTDAPPAGAPDVGPVLTDATGVWRLALPDTGNYWIGAQLDAGLYQWRYQQGFMLLDRVWRAAPSFGSGPNPQAGIQRTLAFPKPFSRPPAVIALPANPATFDLGLYVPIPTAAAFAIATRNAPAPSQPAGTYQAQIIVIGD